MSILVVKHWILTINKVYYQDVPWRDTRKTIQSDQMRHFPVSQMTPYPLYSAQLTFRAHRAQVKKNSALRSDKGAVLDAPLWLSSVQLHVFFLNVKSLPLVIMNLDIYLNSFVSHIIQWYWQEKSLLKEHYCTKLRGAGGYPRPGLEPWSSEGRYTMIGCCNKRIQLLWFQFMCCLLVQLKVKLKVHLFFLPFITWVCRIQWASLESNLISLCFITFHCFSLG